MAAQPFEYQLPADINPPSIGATNYVANVTSVEDLVHAVLELQQRISTWNAANPTNPI
jgi:hypothetical protein